MKRGILTVVILLLAVGVWAQSNRVVDTSNNSNWRDSKPGTGTVYYIQGVRAVHINVGSGGLGNFFTKPDGTVIIREAQLMCLPQRNINAVAGIFAGVDSRAGQIPNIRGTRQDGTAYYLDGIRIYELDGLLW